MARGGLHATDALEHAVEQVVGLHAVAERVVREHEAVAQDVRGEVGDVLGHDVVAAAQQRERLGGLDGADRAARGGAELDQALQLVQAVLAGVAGGVAERDGVADHVAVHVHAAGELLVALQVLGAELLAHLGRGRDRAADDRGLLADGRVVDDQLEQEAVHLRLGQRVGAFVLDRVLRRHDEERLRERVRLAGDRHLALLHDLEQRALHLGGRAVDLVGEQEVAEHRAELGVEAARVGAVDARADEVGRHQVRRELHAAELAAEHVAQGLDRQRLRQAGDALEQHVAAGEQRDEQALEHRVLADDHALELIQRAFQAGARIIELDPRRCLVVVVVHLHAIDCGERFVRSP